MLIHPQSLYKEIIECHEYETRNPTIYGNIIRNYNLKKVSEGKIRCEQSEEN